MLRRFGSILPAALLLVLWSGCSDFQSTDDTGVSDVADTGLDDATTDTNVLSDILFFDVPDIHYSDTEPDMATDVISDVPPEIHEGEPGWPCQQSTDCNSGFCLDTPDGLQCTSFCQTSESCPRGFDCLMVASGSDAVFVCVHTMPKLCMPCRVDSDCASPQTEDFAACVGDNSGRFCAGQCAADGDCPRGYTCVLTQSAAGASTRQCLPTDGVCECSVRAIEESATTVCVLENQIGRCVGEIMCTEAGMLPCNVSEPAVETCNGVDDDCDGTTDDVTTAACLVKNMFGSCPGTTLCQGGVESCQGPQAEQEKCNNLDDNCDGTTDEENADQCTDFYEDVDNDTWGVSTRRKCLCAPTGYYTATRGLDCNDNEPDVNPTKPENCNGVDDNCNGTTDEEGAGGCRNYYYDNDADSYGTAETPKCLCVAKWPWSALRSGDCNDAVGTVNPGAIESCNTIDDNCDGATDPVDASGCESFYYDGDSDGYGSATIAPRCQCGPDYLTKYKVQVGGDCNDVSLTINPAANEKCGDSIDNDCDGQTDEDGALTCTTYYIDSDSDTWGTGTGLCKCAPAAPYTATRTGDCADGDFYRNPSVDEVCGDGIDNDCDAKTDEEGGNGCDFWFFDNDRDGYGDPTKSKCLCAASVSTKYDSATGNDCNDALPAVSPGATEKCGNAIDDDCDGQTDEENAQNCATWYYDSDGDTFGVNTMTKCLCAAKDLYRATVGGDCDDNSATSKPGGIETCAAGDQDCDGFDNEIDAQGCAPYYYDGDADDYGTNDVATVCMCAPNPATGFRALVGGDCDDTNSSIHPDQAETCEPDGTPGIDQNCNGLLNEENAGGCKSYYYDYDKDGHGLKNSTPKCYCTGGNVGLRFTSLVADDCNDSDSTIAGGLPELCDGKDNDCDGTTDENGASDCTTWYFDGDGDGYGVTANSECRCASDPGRDYDTTVPGDCNDANNAIYPGQSVCGVDGSCDGAFLDPLEECDDGNTTNWDGCTACKLSEYRVNSQFTGDQSWPSATLKTGGGWAVAYTSYRTATSDDIAVRGVLNTGAPSGTEVFVNAYTAGVQTYPDIAAMASGLVVVWQSEGQDSSGYGITGRILNLDGTAKFSEFLVNGTATNSQTKPAVAVGPADEIVTVWQSSNQDGSFEGVYGRVHASPGTALTAEALIPQTTALSQTNPDVAIYGAGSKVVVTWTGQVQIDASTTDTRVFFRIFDLSLTPLSNEVQVTSSGTTLVGQDNSAVGIIGSAGFVVAFEDSSSDTDKGIRYRAFDWNGTPLAAPAMANVNTYGMQAAPAVLGLDSNNFVIAWWSLYGDTDGSTGIIGRRFVRGGTNGPETLMNGNATNYQWYPCLAPGTGSSWYGVWMSSQQDGDGSGIYGRSYTF